MLMNYIKSLFNKYYIITPFKIIIFQVKKILLIIDNFNKDNKLNIMIIH